ncbi:histidinol-phosphate transaminase [Nitrosopumilus sp. b1]|uniref:histidinol-phosphate transaminase n=1 Tax=Nitrosopumilus sp. b1 TaxID=2109907 RepID=UPI0015F5CB11|nr:histidinol-phosphate transaminase [Nitrosopumilus sp. b1]KAF6242355.1 histidinol-phosphate transaminase [Nitrosopumilus sp. b1]
MKQNWFENKIKELSKQSGYEKPEKFQDTLKLDSNENFVIPKQLQNDLINTAKKTSDIREYPLGGTERLIQALSKYLKIPTSMIGVGNGSDQILDLILANFASKQTKVLTSDPTFGFFEERCKLFSIPTIKIPFSKNMTLNLEKFLEKSKNSDILYLDSPNNPTGFQFSKPDAEKLIKNFDGLVIIDEAYVEFADYSIANLTKKYPNLIVVQTFSKAFGLAGLRLGYFIANKKFTDVFNRVIQYPYPINSIAIEAGISALEKAKYMKDAAKLVQSERKRILDNLKKYDAFEVFNSKANFILFDAKGADKRVFTALVEQGISIRKLGKIGEHPGCLRVTVGTKDMNSKFLLAIRDLLG